MPTKLHQAFAWYEVRLSRISGNDSLWQPWQNTLYMLKQNTTFVTNHLYKCLWRV